ncbi:hypothetical protein [Amycolatopsis sp.]|jgi:hypothetical protein|uniref:hypothetical protein n=1 Tax=Amycolatopsis sp. TaxID=37632 RepID=UPI002DF809B5|nr:hypothetical protein [Amycolatopsis sp.]
MTEDRPPEPEGTEPPRFVDPLTGWPIPEEPRPEPLDTPDEPAAEPRNRLRRRIALSLAGVLVLAMFVGVVVVIGDSPEFSTSASDVETPVPMPGTSRPRPETLPVVAGWKPVVSDDHPFAFDVPPDWTVENPGVIVGFEAPGGDLLSLHGVARFKSNFCPYLDVSSRAQAGFTAIRADEVNGIREAAEETVVRWAEAAYSSADFAKQPRVTVTKAQPVQVFGGSVEAMEMTATVRPVEPNACSPPSVALTAVVLPLNADADAMSYHVHLTLADQEIGEGLQPDVAAEIISSIRRAG